MPGVSRYGINPLRVHLEPLVEKGLKSILLFGVVEKIEKVSQTHFLFKFCFNTRAVGLI
jgi:delta-aminolevulinic acid dehydratase/porphobilinogen synthase